MDLEYCLLLLGVALMSTSLGEDVKVTTIQEKPYMEKEGNEFKGFIKDMMDEIEEKTDLKFTWTEVRDGKYGASTNGNWNGMVKELMQSSVKIAAAPMTINKQRKQVIDFSVPFMSFGTTIVIKRPEEGEENPINSAEDLADQTEIGYGMVKDGETQRFFKNATTNPYKKMWQYMDNHRDLLVDEIEEGIEKVREKDGKYALIIESSTADYHVNRDPCDLIKVGENFNDKSYGLGIRKGSADLKKKINDAIKELKDEGKIEELRKKWWNTDAKCSASTSLITFSTWTISLIVALISSR